MGPGGEMRPTFLLCYVGSAVEFCGHGRIAKGSPRVAEVCVCMWFVGNRNCGKLRIEKVSCVLWIGLC